MSRQLRRITYVEDEPDIRTITEMALETIGGFDLDTYECGFDAVENASKFETDLILLDVMMPGMDGPQVFKAFAETEEMKDKPVIFMTARTQKSEVAEYLALGAKAVIPKPFDPITLSDQIRDVWNEFLVEE